jgi:hypothetical protein
MMRAGEDGVVNEEHTKIQLVYIFTKGCYLMSGFLKRNGTELVDGIINSIAFQGVNRSGGDYGE